MADEEPREGAQHRTVNKAPRRRRVFAFGGRRWAVSIFRTSRANTVFGFGRPRVWHVGDSKPMDNPPVSDAAGRGWRFDPVLARWIYEVERYSQRGSRPGMETFVELSCGTWDELLTRYGPLKDR